MSNYNINSENYWDHRFQTDWESNQGREQTKFFANVAMEHLPEWLFRDINNNKFSICDVGCAEGDAVPILNNKFFMSEITGIDFSETAINTARNSYPNFNFSQCAIEDLKNNFDVIFISNVLEHFTKPFQMIDKLIQRTNEHLIIMIPFQEYDRCKEHFFTFDYEHIPLKIDNFNLSFFKVIDCSKYPNSLWSLKQILLVYTNVDRFNKLNLSLDTISGTIIDLEKNNLSLEVNIRNLHEEINQLNEKINIEENKFRKELNQLHDEINDLQHEIYQLHKEIERMIDKNSLLIKESTDLAKLKELISEENENYQKQIFNLQLENDRLKNEINSIYTSRVWRYFVSKYYKLRNKFENKQRSLPSQTVTEQSQKIDQNQAVLHRDVTSLSRIIEENKGKSIVIFPNLVDWNIPLFQRPQHIALNLAKEGYLYFYCTNNVVDKVDGFEEVSENCYVTSMSESELIKEVANYKDRKKFIHLYSTDNIRDVNYIKNVTNLGFNILYEYVDEIHEEISGQKIPEAVLKRHDYLLKNEQYTVVATADKLYKEVIAVRNNNCALITNGVEYGHFDQKSDEIPIEIEKIVKSGKPVIGYFGAFAKWFDYELVEKVAQRFPNWEILLIGQDYDGSIHASNIKQYSNIHVVGPINYKQLPKYAQYFSVSTIPFLINDITESTSPIKLFEYMALGKPIVTTAMPECRKYKSVFVGENHEDFLNKIENAVNGNLPADYYEIMKEEYLSNTWNQKARNIIKLLDKRI